ncbi:MAG: excisionase family DNA-binding protein [Kiloniellaceae bacterium]
MNDDILTTARAAKLLGVSVRTTQLLIESGALASWKTPGGHRRVYRSDVLAYMAGTNPARTSYSARIILLASAKRLPALQSTLETVAGYAVEAHTDISPALLSLGAQPPAAVVVDLEEAARSHRAFLQQIAEVPALAQTRLVAVGGGAGKASQRADADIHRAEAETLATTLRSVLARSHGSAEPFSSAPPFPIAPNEAQRLAALERSGLLRSTADKPFDQLTWLASYSLQAPVALMTMLTATQQLFKSRQGLELTETPRSWAFCNYTILQRGVFTVGDLAGDARFASNPAVMDAPHFRFYAGAPVVDPDGFALGSLCIIDYEPRRLDASQEKTLKILAAFASGTVRGRAGGRLPPDGRGA